MFKNKFCTYLKIERKDLYDLEGKSFLNGNELYENNNRNEFCSLRRIRDYNGKLIPMELFILKVKSFKNGNSS